MWLLTFGKVCIHATVITLIMLFVVPGLPPQVDFDDEAFEFDESIPERDLHINFALDGAERLHEGILLAPESLVSISDEEIYLSLHNGSIARVWGQDFDKIDILANIGPSCAGPLEELHGVCGRPLGLRLSKDKKTLFVADADLGIFAIDTATGIKENLVDAQIPIEGVRPRLVDDLDIDSDGNIYWSDASSSDLSACLVEYMSAPSGRLIKSNPKTKSSQVILSNIHFANGVQLSRDERFVLVAETFRYRVIRLWLKGPKAGAREIFVSGLPGMPDNIRPRQRGGYYISLVVMRHPADTFDLLESMSQMPVLAKIFLRAAAILQKTFELIYHYYPNRLCAEASRKVLGFGIIMKSKPVNDAMVVEVDETGNIIGSLRGSSGQLQLISQAQQVGNNLIFGSPFSPYLGRIRLDKLKPQSSLEDKADFKAKPGLGKQEL